MQPSTSPVQPPPLSARATRPITAAFTAETRALLRNLGDTHEPKEAAAILRQLEARCDYYAGVVELIHQGGL